MVETSRSSRFLVVSPAEGTAKKLPKSKQCPKKLSSVLWALRSCLCGGGGGCCCCCSCASAAAVAGDDDTSAADKEAQRREGGSCNRSLLGLMGGLAGCRRPAGGTTSPEKNFPISPQATKVSDSQIDFFKMLDERIENGPDDESLDDTRGKLFSRSAFDDPRQVPPTLGSGGSHPSALHRRWSASKITNPRTPSSPDRPKDSLMRRDRLPGSRSPESPPEADDERQSRLLPLDGDVDSPGDDASSSDQTKENFKEQYVFLGNVYTVTRPVTRRTSLPASDRSESPALIAVAPRMTEEDLHLQTLLDSNSPTYQNEKMLGGEASPEKEANQFWMDFEMPDIDDNQAGRILKARPGRSMSCDIIRPGLSGLRPVIE